MTAKIAATTSRTNRSVHSPEACAVEWTLLTQSDDTENVDEGNHDGEKGQKWEDSWTNPPVANSGKVRLSLYIRVQSHTTASVACKCKHFSVPQHVRLRVIANMVPSSCGFFYTDRTLVQEAVFAE